jgi:hypothetical protein
MPSSRQETTPDVASTPVVAATNAPASQVSHIATDPSATEWVDVEASRQTSLPPLEIGGREGPEPTRFGDWEKRGRCIDF